MDRLFDVAFRRDISLRYFAVTFHRDAPPWRFAVLSLRDVSPWLFAMAFHCDVFAATFRSGFSAALPSPRIKRTLFERLLHRFLRRIAFFRGFSRPKINILNIYKPFTH